jgi:BlaI family penicillinase repressor
MEHTALSRRERQIMDILYALGSATIAQVHEKMPGELSYSTVRAQLRVLEEKGHVTHVEDGPRYTYRPTVARDKARRSALRHLTDTFFEGSTWNVVNALLGGKQTGLTQEQLDKLAEMIERARKEQSE